MTCARRIVAVLEHDAQGRPLATYRRGGLDVPYVETAARYLAHDGVDEVWLHLTEPDARGVAGLYEPVRALSSTLFLPIVAWGAVKSGPDARILVGMGADRVVVDASDTDEPVALVGAVANAVGPDQTVAAIDVRRVANHGTFVWEQCRKDGMGTGRDACDLVKAIADAGAGEIVLIPRFGSELGPHPTDLVEQVVTLVWIQILSVGEEREPADLAAPLLLGADGVLTTTTLADGTMSVGALKAMLTEYGVTVRPAEPPYVIR